LPNLTIAGGTKDRGTNFETPGWLVVHNAAQLHSVLNDTKANVKAIFADICTTWSRSGSTASLILTVCGNYWKGAQHGCPEGFLVVDLSSDGNVGTNYQSFGWKAAV
jgi:hypothetical protein